MLLDPGVIAIVRGRFPRERLLAAGEALAEAGVRAMEVTLNSPDALEGIAALRRALDGRVLVGAGTVRTAGDVERALAAGAAFLVSPNIDLPSVSRARAAGVPHLPGVFTPTEAQTASTAGCRLVKLFPADLLGPRYLRALRAPLDHIGFVPTGGILLEEVGEWVRAGAVALGVGSALVSRAEEDPASLAERAARFVRAMRDARSGAGEADG
jgi:2-dehydro-3-deoxyphosphogluconate aldolase / (4S)-4-hydroxy-2-oxoglutarate aldolase